MTLKELHQAEGKIGIRLRETRIDRGFPQVELADLAGTNQAVIQKIKNGKVRHPRIVDGLAIALQVNPAWLQWGEPYEAMSVKQTFRAPF